MTNVVAISRCKNEADIIEPWVRHTLQHVDRMVVSDNDSVDDTLDILRALQAEGLPITVLQEAMIGDYQAKRFNELMLGEVFSKEITPVDWIVPLDTDEFIETLGHRLADILTLGPQVVRSMPWKSMAWSATDDQADVNPVTRMRHRLVGETYYQKVQVPTSVVRAGGLLCTGSHFMAHDGDQGKPIDGAQLCHFPLRSVDQYKLKASLAYLQSACVPGWDRKTGFQFGELPNAVNIEEQALTKYSRRYASHNPPTWEPTTIDQPLAYLGGPLRYTAPADRFITTLLRQSEKMALKIAELTK